MIAISAPGDALGIWHKWANDADMDNDLQLFNDSADYPGFGVDAYNVYVTANMFDINDYYQHSKGWGIPKAQLRGFLMKTLRHCKPLV